MLSDGPRILDVGDTEAARTEDPVVDDADGHARDAVLDHLRFSQRDQCLKARGAPVLRRGRRRQDLTAAPFARQVTQWTHPTDYGACQALADVARQAGVEAILYESAHVPGRNVGLLTCKAFASREPVERQAWQLHFGAPGARAICSWPELRLSFDRLAFVSDPRIASMRWER